MKGQLHKLSFSFMPIKLMCARGDSNPHPTKGPDPKSGAAANYATGAFRSRLQI